MVKKYIRIVAGQYRRTPIPVVDAPGLRPTPDRVRETLYNWIHHLWSGHFEDKQVLDLFAGSGALGFEAASRGAQHVQMVEHDTRAISALRNLRDKLKADQVRIHAGDVKLALQRMDASRFDLILLDPPFGTDWLETLWPALPGLLKPEGLVYLESDKKLNIPENFQLLRQASAGNVHYHLVQIVASQK